MPDTAKSMPPWTIITAVALTGIELALFAGSAVADLFINFSQLDTAQMATDGFYVLAALLIGFATWKLWTGKAWARSVIVTWHLLVVFASLTLIKYLGWIGPVGIVLSAVAVLVLIHPEARDHIDDTRASRLFDD